MAKQKSHVKYTGTLGEIRHFKIKGKEGYFAGLKGGVDGETIRTDPNFARTRENMQEFAGAAKTGKALRQGFPQLIRQMGSSGYTGRITGLMKRICNRDTNGTRGERLISVVGNPELVEGFEINKDRPFSNTCNLSVNLAVNLDRNEVVWTIDPFDPEAYILAPQGTSHFRLILAVAALSDYAFDANVDQYNPVNTDFDGLKVRQDSGYLPVSDPVASAITVTSTLPTTDPVPADVAVIGAVAIEFVQEVNGEMYPLSDGHAMQFARVF